MTTWACEKCDMSVEGKGPWCNLYLKERGGLCLPVCEWLLNKWEDEGDRVGAFAMALYISDRWNVSVELRAGGKDTPL